MKHFTLLSVALLFILSASSQYDVDIKPNGISPSPKQAAVEEIERSGHCKFVALINYKPGMKFYFPKDESREKEDDDVLYYYLTKEEKKADYNRTKIPYKGLSGKVFEVTKFEEKEKNYLKRGLITLKDVNSDYSIQYQTPVPIELLKDKLESGSTTFNLNYAIYTPEIDSFKNYYVGKELYTKFKINGRKFQKVKVVQVGAGTESAPVRIIFETASGTKDQTDVCTCGTNVPGEIGDIYRFTDFFALDNPHDEYKSTNDIWDLICEERVRIGMSEQDLLLSWGKPDKINQTIMEGKNSKQFVYSKGFAYVENGVVTALQNR